MMIQYLVFASILGSGMWVSVYLKKLTVAGALTGGLIGCLIFLGTGFTGIAMTALFFILGSFATSWKWRDKEASGIAEENKSGRTAGQVAANTGIAGVTSLLAWLVTEHTQVLQLMASASIAAAAGDTLSSELGNVYGRRFYNILSFRKDTRGLDGVVSLEGTLFGLAGSSLIAALYGIGFGWNTGVVLVIAAGLAGNLADSVLGAALERKHLLENNAVNFLNTCTAALTAGLLYLI